MQKRFSVLLLVIVSIFIPLTVTAQQETTTDTRLAQAVSDQQLTLDEATKALITAKCTTAQQQIVKLKDKTGRQVKLRMDTYSDIQKELQAIKLRMGRQGIDASEIDLLIGKIQQHLDSFTTASNSYITTLQDIATVDCAQKPEQFEAGLVLARGTQAQLFKEANSLKSTLNTADTSTFNQLKKRLTVQ